MIKSGRVTCNLGEPSIQLDALWPEAGNSTFEASRVFELTECTIGDTVRLETRSDIAPRSERKCSGRALPRHPIGSRLFAMTLRRTGRLLVRLGERLLAAGFRLAL